MKSDKVRLLVKQSVWFIWDSSAFRLQVTAALNCSDSQLVTLITSSFVNVCSGLEVFLVAEEHNAIAICNACSARIPRGGKKASSFNTTNLISHLKGYHRGEAKGL